MCNVLINAWDAALLPMQTSLHFALQLCVVLPLAQVSAAPEGWGLSEDSWDSLVMIGSRPLLQLLLLAYTGSLAAYNICGMVTTGE